MKIKNGDLVEVIYLPNSMAHFTVASGTVCKMDANGDFFIQRVSKLGKIIKGSASGWYSEENVKVLVEGYHRGVLDGENVYKDVKNLRVILEKATIRMKKVKETANKHNKAYTAFLFGDKL